MRKLLFPVLIIVAALILLARLFFLQILDDSYIKQSDNNALKIVYDYPERGYIYDRNGHLLVANQPSYDIMVIPREVKNIDTLELCKILDLSREDFDEKLRKATVYSPRLPSVFLAQLTKIEFSAFQEKLRHFNGFYVQKRNLRDYQVDYGANIFGYIRQVNEAEIKRNPYYRSGDLIGIQGVEQAYEEDLRGTKGVRYIQRDKFNREIGPFKDGVYDTAVIKGKDIHITIDAQLQQYGEELMKNKRGGIVAIEPKTGEILALVTAPYYDPGLMVGRNRSRNYIEIDARPGMPMFNRALQGSYAPGSPFKIFTSLVGLQEEVIDTQTSFTCRHGFYYAPVAHMKCHDSGNWSLHRAIASSCNTYFSQAYRMTIGKFNNSKMGMEAWHNHLTSFGFGDFLGYDLPVGTRGRIPDADYYDRWYPRGSWGGTTTISNAIGQGEIEASPIQLANAICAVANEGYYYTPHIIKSIKGKEIDKSFVERKTTTVDKQYFRPIIEGLHEVYKTGTARRLQVEGIDICGKTGTVENFVTFEGEKTKLTDHSVFVSFAPKENPQIVICVFIENGGFGATWAGPISTLMVEKYLNDEITRTDLEDRMLAGSLADNYVFKDQIEEKNKEKDRLKRGLTRAFNQQIQLFSGEN